MVPREHPSTYRFADFELGVRACRLTRGGQPVKLEPKAFDVLRCLLRRGGDIASRRDLVAEAWGGIAITDNAVARVIAHLRRALDDHPDRPRFVETIPTRGYRFIGQIEVVADAPGTPSWASTTLRPRGSRKLDGARAATSNSPRARAQLSPSLPQLLSDDPANRRCIDRFR